MRELVIIGAGGFGRETIDVVLAINAVKPTWNILGVIDDSPSKLDLTRLSGLKLAHLGGLPQLPRSVEVAVAIGHPQTRNQIVSHLSDRNCHYPSLIHPESIVGSNFQHGEGLIILGGAILGTNVSIDNHVHLNAGAVIGHDAKLRDFVSVNPGAVISGNCIVENECLIGASSTVLQGISVRNGATVGAGACVISHVPSKTTVVGVPATPISRQDAG